MSRFAVIGKIPARYLVMLSLLGYILLALWFPLLPGYDREPVADVRTFAPSLLGGLLYGLVLLSLFALHVLLYQRISRTVAPSPGRILAVTTLLALPLLFMYPINANDVYRYVARGLIRSRYGLSPFEYAPADFGDELYPFLVGEWGDVTSPYGPLWELTASAVTTIGRDNLLLNLLLFKILGLLSLLAASVLLWSLLASRDTDSPKQGPYLVLWAWNPALLISFVGNAHNDALMIATLLLGWLVLRRGYHGPGLLIMFSAALFKPIALLALPLVFLGTWRDLGNLRRQLPFTLWLLGGGALILGLAFLPFGSPETLAGRLLREAGGGASFSPTTLLILLSRQFGWTDSFNTLAMAGVVAFAAFFFWLLWQTWRGKAIEAGLANVFWGYILQALNFRIWYAVWPFPWSLLDAYGGAIGKKRMLHTSLWFLVTSQLSVILYGHLRVALLGGDYLLAHLIGVPFVFFLPFVLARYTVRDQGVSQKPGSKAQADEGPNPGYNGS
jgi:hypothetical protein